MTTIILCVALLLTSSACLFFLTKYNKLKTMVDKTIIELKKPIRLGYYKMSLSTNDKLSFESLVYVNEIDRFTNGESKIEINKIEIGVDSTKVSSDSVNRFIKDKFKSLMKTSEIEWLESEQNIKDIRKNKLEQLKESLKK